jgi:hypothetical protein
VKYPVIFAVGVFKIMTPTANFTVHPSSSPTALTDWAKVKDVEPSLKYSVIFAEGEIENTMPKAKVCQNDENFTVCIPIRQIRRVFGSVAAALLHSVYINKYGELAEIDQQALHFTTFVGKSSYFKITLDTKPSVVDKMTV